MDAPTQAFVTEIVSRRIAENWLYWCLFLAASFLASFAGAYIKRRAENLATKADFDELKRQLDQTTRLTEDIKSEVGHAEWKAREINALHRAKLEKILELAYEASEHVALGARNASTGESVEWDDSSVNTLVIMSTLYFPGQFELIARDYAHEYFEYKGWSLGHFLKLRRGGQAARPALIQESKTLNAAKYRALVEIRQRLEDAAKEEMKGLLAVPRRAILVDTLD